MIIVVLCVFLVQGLLVKGFPTGQLESSDGETIADGVSLVEPVSVGDIVEYKGTVPASEPVTLSKSDESLQEAISESTGISSENNATKSDLIGLIENNNKPILVDTILGEEKVKVNQTLASVDKLVESKLEKVDKQFQQPSFKNASFTNKMDSAVHGLMELQSKMASELLIIKNTIESELELIRKQIRFAVLESKIISDTVLNATDLLTDVNIAQSEKKITLNKENTEQVKVDCDSPTLKTGNEPLLVEEEKIEAELAKINDYIQSELAKIDLFVESELALTEVLIQSEVDKVNLFVESKFKTANLVESASFTNKMDSAVHGLMELQSKMASELLIIKNTIESELELIRKQIRFAVSESKIISDTVLNATDLLTDVNIAQSEEKITLNKENTEQVKVDCDPPTLKTGNEPLLVEGEKIETELAKINDYIQSELAKIDLFVESELALTEALIQSEVDNVNLFVESKFKTANLVESEMTDLESILESELAIEVPVEGFAEFSGVVPASGRAVIFGNTGYSPMFPVLEEHTEEIVKEEVATQKAEVPVVDEVLFTGTVPVFGRTIIFGSTGCLHPNLASLGNHSTKTAKRPNTIPISVESGPLTLGSTEYTSFFDAIEPVPETEVMLNQVSPIEPNIFEEDISETVPVIGKAVFSGVTPAVGSVKILGRFGCDSLFPSVPPEVGNPKPITESKTSQEYNSDRNKLPLGDDTALNIHKADDRVPQIDNILVDNIVDKEKDENPIEVALAEGHAEFNGISRATGKTRLVANFGCRPLLPTAETPDGKKYLWIAKRPNANNAPPPVSRKPEDTNKSDFPRNFPMVSKFSPEFPETVIMDSTKNYERLIEEYEVLGDHEIDHEGDVKVVGEVYFEGKAPAFGSVSITGHT